MNGLLTGLMNAPRGLQRAAAIMLLIAFAGLAAGSVAAMASLLNAKHAELQALRDTAGRFARVAALEESLKASLGALENGKDRSLFVEAESAAIARAALQSRLGAIAAKHKLSVVSVGGLPDRDENGYQLIGLRADVVGRFEAVHGTVLDIEGDLPPLFIRELTLRLNGPPGGPDTPAVQITAQIQLYAAYRAPATASARETRRAELAP
ncbi:type II secretion system protein GspM [Oricola cellulosilytica]|uniref:General secretion pathway protein GspM n=1 Tax=Oricola cellulosilytica TaxID=1429082 RepID=A0A4R0PN29_9HYPH|nr:type II secretion system protein GspM [Oricola cellulosilytica]TCD16659.1 hypothetical protein E0D97_04405 [Oricola cellulosilytica]